MVLSGLKTLLETGETLTTPGSLMYLGRRRSGSRGPRGGPQPAVESAFSIFAWSSPVASSSRVMSHPPMNSPPM